MFPSLGKLYMLLTNDYVLHVSDVCNVDKKWMVRVLVRNCGTIVCDTFRGGNGTINKRRCIASLRRFVCRHMC